MQKFTFRGKSQDNGEWVIGNNIVADTKRAIINGVIVDTATIGQYARRTDRYGNPIFTGDIISFDDDNIIVESVLPEPERTISCCIKGNIYDTPDIVKYNENNI